MKVNHVDFMFHNQLLFLNYHYEKVLKVDWNSYFVNIILSSAFEIQARKREVNVLWNAGVAGVGRRKETSRHKLLLSGAEWSIFNIHIIPEFRWFYI